MSHLFADIYDGIRCLRILKGVSEKDILNYVQARVGNMKVGNVLKTIRTLRKLVDEGILVKKGKRYSFSGKAVKKECYETEDENQGDEYDEDDECDMDDDDAKDEDEEQDEDDDEDDDDDGCGDEEDGEEDDFDDDDDDNCNNDNQEGGDDPSKDEKKMEEDNSKDSKRIDSKSSFIMRPRVEESQDGNQKNNNNNSSNKATDDPGPVASESEKEKRRGNKRKKIFVGHATGMENSTNQGMAFCARDFIDSLQPAKEEETEETPEAEGKSRSVTESRERSEKYVPRNRGSRLKWDREPHCSYRSRSPVKDRNRECHDNLNMGRSDDLGSSNPIFQDPVDAEGEIEEKNKESAPESPVRQTKSQEGSQPKVSAKSPSKGSKYVVEVIESEVYPKESIIKCVPENRAANGTCTQRNWMEVEDRGQERTKRGLSDDDIRSYYDDKVESLCSVCDKKRRNS